MKIKILNICLILSSFIGYLEWGTENQMFLIQGEIDIVIKFIDNPTSVIHPFILLPFAGQFMLLITLFQKKPGRILTFIGLGCLAILLVFMFVIGLISLNFKLLISTVPFIICGDLVILQLTRRKNHTHI